MEVKSVKEFASLLIERTKQNFDNILIIESGSVKGTGKTTFTADLEEELCKQQGFEFNLREIIIFDPTNEKIIEKVKNTPDGYPIHIDEASKVAYKRNYAKDVQKDLIIFINVCRKFHKIILINNPSFWGLDKDLLDLADFRVVILKRGIALVCGKDKNPDSRDKWRRDPTNLAVEKNPRNILDADAMINLIRRNDNYLFEVQFNVVNPKIYAEYERISKEAEVAGFLENAKKEDLKQCKLEAILGILNFLNEHLDGDRMTSIEMAQIVNKYMEKRGKRGIILPDNLRTITTMLDGMGFNQIIASVKEEWFGGGSSEKDNIVYPKFRLKGAQNEV